MKEINARDLGEIASLGASNLRIKLKALADLMRDKEEGDNHCGRDWNDIRWGHALLLESLAEEAEAIGTIAHWAGLGEAAFNCKLNRVTGNTSADLFALQRYLEEEMERRHHVLAQAPKS